MVKKSRKTKKNFSDLLEKNLEICETSRYMKGGWIDPKTLPVNREGFRMCRYCSDSVIPPRRTFCSNECVHNHRLRTSGAYLRQTIYQRDNAICAICNVDTKKTAKELRETEDPEELKLRLSQLGISAKRKIHKRKLGGGLWDADHIVRVADGGGQCDMDNLRTLCIACHKIITITGNKKKKKSDYK